MQAAVVGGFKSVFVTSIPLGNKTFSLATASILGKNMKQNHGKFHGLNLGIVSVASGASFQLRFVHIPYCNFES